jgi:hypothetical protein
MAQNLLSQLKDGETVKGTSQWYKSKKIGKYIGIENTQNKFANIKQNSPNLPINLTPSKFDIILAKDKLTKICAKYITLQQLVTMAPIEKSGLMIEMRTDIYGKILEIGFFTDQNSILNLQQLEEIEDGIKTRSDLVNIKPDIRRYLEGSNFWLIREKFYYVNILKTKQEMERPKHPNRNERN